MIKAVILYLTHNHTMRNKMSCSSCKREITDDACVTLRKEDGTYYMLTAICVHKYFKN
jgi:hypothetical protein